MSEPRFTLYYWPLAFRGCFVSYQFAYKNHPLRMASTEELMAFKSKRPSEQPVPFVGPPVLHDRDADLYLSQMPAIVLYASDVLDLAPTSTTELAQGMKVLMDCNDVLMEICRNNGSSMWDRESWARFRGQRLPKWMSIFEESLERGVLGHTEVRFADVSTYALFGNMTRCLPQLEEDLTEHAPGIHALCQRLGEHPPLARFVNEQAAQHGNTYCGGQIEASIRAMLDADEST